MGVLLALAAACAYGLSDFVGGVASRRTSSWPVAVLAGVGALLGAVVLAFVLPGQPSGADLAWGAVSGLGGGAGSGFLYRGFSAGRMGVAAPVSAVGSAVVPVLAGVAGGERPALLVWIGIALALPGIWFVSREPQAGVRLADGLTDGVLAGIGFGLLFAAIGQVPDHAGYWPLALGQLVSLLAVAAMAALLGAGWRPTARSEGWGLLAGVLASVAVLGFLASTHTGLLTVAAVITSLYPASTVLLATALLREPVHRTQGLGMLLCAGAVALVAAG